ncbi:MAG: hypothetical protein U0236_21330 [Nitrospira sp.]
MTALTFADLAAPGPHHHHHGGHHHGGGGSWWGGGGPWYPYPYIEPLIIERVETEEERKKRLEREAKLKKEQEAIQMTGYADFLTEEALKHGTVRFHGIGHNAMLDQAMQTFADFLTEEALKHGTVYFNRMNGLGDSAIDAAAAAAAAIIASRTAVVTIKKSNGSPYTGPVQIVRLDDSGATTVDTITADANGNVSYLIPVDDTRSYYFLVADEPGQKGNTEQAVPGSSIAMSLSAPEPISGGSAPVKSSFPVLPVAAAAIIGFLVLKG